MTDFFFEIRRGASHIFLDGKDSETVSELKNKIHAILMVKPDDQQLYFNDKQLINGKTLSDIGFNSETASVLEPARLVLSLKKSDGAFEERNVTPMSTPPPLDELLRRQTTAGGDSKETKPDQEPEKPGPSGDPKNV